MMENMGNVEWWPWIALLTGAGVTYACRAAGVTLAGRINPNGIIYAWFEAVAYALLAGLIARMIILPVGALEDVELLIRLGAAAIALLAFLLLGRSVIAGTFAGALIIMLAT